MSCIEIDLDNYKDEIKYTFCNEHKCLRNLCNKQFKNKLQEYIEDLDRSIYIFGDCKKTPEDILRDLKYIVNSLI